MRVAVVGAGLSGLAAAKRLSDAGHDVVVLGRGDRAGGSLRTERHGGYLVDTGCDLLNGSYTRLLALAGELGLELELSSTVIDVVRDGRPVSFDSAHRSTLARGGLLSARGKLALARGWLKVRRRLAALDAASLGADENGPDGPALEFATDTFGAEVAERLIDPVVRAFAGTGLEHASALSVLGALSAGGAPMVALRGGMGALPDALARGLDVRLSTPVTGIEERRGAVEVAAGDEHLEVDACVLAVSYHAAAELWPALGAADPGFGASLRPVPLMSISLGYATEIGSRAYGVLVPTREDSDLLLGGIQQHKAPDRAPEGHSLVTLFTEAMATPRHLERGDDEVLDWAAQRLEAWYPELRGHRDMGVVSRWPNTGYVPTPGFWQRVRDLRGALPAGRVHVASALFGSGSAERAVVGGERVAARVTGAREAVAA